MEIRTGKRFAFSSFVFDPHTGELRRRGHPVHMPDQVARLLALLIERKGEMVTRDDLRVHLWPEGEAIDYDRSINRAVSQLRAILKERHSKTVDYIDTLPRRGYRFTGELREIETASSEPMTRQTLSAQPTGSESANAQSTKARPVAIQIINPQPMVSQMAHESPASPRQRTKAWVALVSVVLILLLAAAFGWKQVHKPVASSQQVLSMGIVPFEASGDGAAALAESFRLDLADSLSQVPQLQIRAAHSFDHIQDESVIESRAREFGIETLLIGRLSITGSVCQLRLELVRSRDGVHLFSLQYSGTKEELGTIRDRVEKDIFERLNPADRSGKLAFAKPSSPQAYVAYLQGRAYLQEWTDDALGKALASFREALRIDPHYARAYAAQASAYCILATHGFGDRENEFRLARENAVRALAIDPSLAEAHGILGQVAWSNDWNFAYAEGELRRATELDPSHAIYHQWLSVLLCTQHKFDLAFDEIDRAHAADPDWAPLYMTEIFIAGNAHQYARADRAAAALLARKPDWPLAHEQDAMNLWAWGHGLAAIEEWHKAALLDKNPDRAHLEEVGAEAYRKGGPRAYARVRLDAIATGKGVSLAQYDFIPAEWHAYAGDWDETLDDLDRLIASRSPEAVQVATDPAYGPLYKNHRFLAMLKRAGLPLPPESGP